MAFSVAPLGLKSELVFVCRQGFHYIPPPAYSSYVPTRLCGTSEPHRGDGMDRQAVSTPADEAFFHHKITIIL
jgi:hypothetical protein